MNDALDRVLKLVAEGRLSADEAAPILDALDERPASDPATAAAAGDGPAAAGGTDGDGRTPRFARVEVRESGRRIVDLRVPISLGRFALSRIPGLSLDDITRVEEAVASGVHGAIFDVEDQDGDGVRIVLE